MSLWEVLNYEGVAVVLWIFSIVGLLGFSFTAGMVSSPILYPLYAVNCEFRAYY